MIAQQKNPPPKQPNTLLAAFGVTGHLKSGVSGGEHASSSEKESVTARALGDIGDGLVVSKDKGKKHAASEVDGLEGVTRAKNKKNSPNQRGKRK